ncbi:MAG: DUF72 domain-containing protein [Bryobacteraceae bacterium]|nr:DUF72 domain-containing protein [Bryobacteraceae bacterium]
MPRQNPEILCGPSGWSNIQAAPKQHSLEFVAEHFDAVEVPDTFSEFLRPEVTRVWLKKVAANPGFQFSAKLHRHFTHDRLLDPHEISEFKDGLWPLMRAGRLGCVLMQFPWSFRYTAENREHLIRLRRTFHEFPLAAEMRHSSWMLDEAVGTFIDYHVGFCNIDQPSYTKAMPPTSFLTSSTGYVRLHGRNAFNWFQDPAAPRRVHRYDYLYSDSELAEWKSRIERISGFAAKTFVITNNDAGGKAVINALQLRSLLKGGDGRDLPPELLRRYPQRSQGALFTQYPGRAVA